MIFNSFIKIVFQLNYLIINISYTTQIVILISSSLYLHNKRLLHFLILKYLRLLQIIFKDDTKVSKYLETFKLM